MSYEEQAKLVLRDISTSYWLKEAIRALHKADVVDALRDVSVLQALLKMKWEEVLVETQL